MKLKLNIEIFLTLTYIYGKTVWSMKNLDTPSYFGDQCSSGYVESFRITEKADFFCWPM